MTSYNQDKRALYDRWQQPGDQAQYKKITETVSDNETAPMTSRYVQKENTLSGESISLAYEFGEQKWLKKVFLKNMTIRANMNVRPLRRKEVLLIRSLELFLFQ